MRTLAELKKDVQHAVASVEKFLDRDPVVLLDLDEAVALVEAAEALRALRNAFVLKGISAVGLGLNGADAALAKLGVTP